MITKPICYWLMEIGDGGTATVSTGGGTGCLYPDGNG